MIDIDGIYRTNDGRNPCVSGLFHGFAAAFVQSAQNGTWRVTGPLSAAFDTLTHLEFRTSVREGNFRHQASHQANAPSIAPSTDGEVIGIRQRKIESWARIANRDCDVRRAHFYRAMDRLRGIVAATVQRRVRQRFLQSYQNVNLLGFISAVLTNKLHYSFARFRYRCQIARTLKFLARNYCRGFVGIRHPSRVRVSRNIICSKPIIPT